MLHVTCWDVKYLKSVVIWCKIAGTYTLRWRLQKRIHVAGCWLSVLSSHPGAYKCTPVRVLSVVSSSYSHLPDAFPKLVSCVLCDIHARDARCTTLVTHSWYTANWTATRHQDPLSRGRPPLKDDARFITIERPVWCILRSFMFSPIVSICIT